MDDALDRVVCLDEVEYAKGFSDGVDDGKKSNFRSDGIRAGFMKGYALGLESSFYEENLRRKQENRDSNDTVDTKVTLLIQELQLVKSDNSAEIDYDLHIRSVRQQYKSIKPTHTNELPHFLDKKSTSSSTSW